MKKIILILALILMGITGANARDTFSRDVNDLPQAARTVLKSNFKAGVSVIKIDKDFGMISEYDVTLSDGSEISFDSKGNWKDVEVASNKSVPKGFIPSAISNYIKKNQSSQRIVGIEKERNGYEVTLSNGIDMKFDKSGNFVKFD